MSSFPLLGASSPLVGSAFERSYSVAMRSLCTPPTTPRRQGFALLARRYLPAGKSRPPRSAHSLHSRAYGLVACQVNTLAIPRRMERSLTPTTLAPTPLALLGQRQNRGRDFAIRT